MTTDFDQDLVVKPHSEIETFIDVGPHGTYSLIVDGRPMVKVVWLNGVRQCLWAVHGPADLDLSLALMKGFIHITALVANEKRVYKQPPADEVLLEKLEGNENGKSERRPKGPSPVGKSGGYRRKSFGKSRQG